MSDGEPSDGERVDLGVLAPEADAGHVVDAAGGDATEVDSVALATRTDVVVAVGDAALAALVDAGVSTPVLPVETRFGGPTGTVETAVERVAAGAYTVRNHPVVGVDAPNGSGRAVSEVVLSTVASATISEYAVETPEHGAGPGEPVARFRADGAVVATPMGSRGYARDAGGPVVTPGTDALAVVPVAPFATDPDHWVVPLADLSLTVERDEVPVDLRVDGRSLGTVACGSAVRLTPDGALRIAVPE